MHKENATMEIVNNAVHQNHYIVANKKISQANKYSNFLIHMYPCT